MLTPLYAIARLKGLKKSCSERLIKLMALKLISRRGTWLFYSSTERSKKSCPNHLLEKFCQVSVRSRRISKFTPGTARHLEKPNKKTKTIFETFHLSHRVACIFSFFSYVWKLALQISPISVK